MNEETIALIDRLADKLGTTGEYLIAIFAKQAPALWLAPSLCFLILLISGIVFYIFMKKEQEEGGDLYEMIVLFSVITFALSLVIFLFTIHPAVMGLLSPEAYAVEKILGSVR